MANNLHDKTCTYIPNCLEISKSNTINYTETI
jgi:hypothetical protein